MAKASKKAQESEPEPVQDEVVPMDIDGDFSVWRYSAFNLQNASEGTAAIMADKDYDVIYFFAELSTDKE